VLVADVALHVVLAGDAAFDMIYPEIAADE
jgi:hypothetical protein